MKIINRIMLSSALLVLLSLLALLSVFTVLTFFLPQGREVMDNDAYSVGKMVDTFDVSKKDWALLDTQLSEQGYALYVMQNENVCYDAASHSTDIYDVIKVMNIDSDILIASMESMDFVATSRDDYMLVAYKIKEQSNHAFWEFVRPVIIVSIITIVFIVLLSQLFTKKWIVLCCVQKKVDVKL